MYTYIKSADPCLSQGRGGAWDHRRCGTFFSPNALHFSRATQARALHSPNPSAAPSPSRSH